MVISETLLGISTCCGLTHHRKRTRSAEANITSYVDEWNALFSPTLIPVGCHGHVDSRWSLLRIEPVWFFPYGPSGVPLFSMWCDSWAIFFQYTEQLSSYVCHKLQFLSVICVCTKWVKFPRKANYLFWIAPQKRSESGKDLTISRFLSTDAVDDTTILIEFRQSINRLVCRSSLPMKWADCLLATWEPEITRSVGASKILLPSFVDGISMRKTLQDRHYSKCPSAPALLARQLCRGCFSRAGLVF